MIVDLDDVSDEDVENIASKTLFYLLQVVQKTIDELYFLCEFQASLEFSERVANVLSSGAADFSELRDRLNRLRSVEREHLLQQEHTREAGLASSFSWNVSVHTPVSVKQKYKKQACRPREKTRPRPRTVRRSVPTASSSKNSDDSGKRWDEYSDENDLGLDLTDTIPTALKGFNEVVKQGIEEPFLTPSRKKEPVDIIKPSLPPTRNSISNNRSLSRDDIDIVESTDASATLKRKNVTRKNEERSLRTIAEGANSPKFHSTSLLDLPGEDCTPYLSLIQPKDLGDIPSSPEPYRANFRQGAPRPSDLQTPTPGAAARLGGPGVPSIILNWENSEPKTEENEREQTFSPDSDTSNTATWSETIDVVLSGPARDSYEIGWLAHKDEEERETIHSFFIRTARRHGELRENVNTDMKRKFGLTEMQVDNLYSIFGTHLQLQASNSFSKKDPGRSLSLAAERGSQRINPVSPHEKKAWEYAKRIEIFRSKLKRKYLNRMKKRRIWEELKKERDASQKRAEYVEARTSGNRKWEERKQQVDEKNKEEARRREQELEERAEKAEQLRRAREQEITQKAQYFENRVREIRLLDKLEGQLEANRLIEKEQKREHKAQEAQQRRIENAGRSAKSFEERRAEVHNIEKEQAREFAEEINKRHFESRLRLMEREATKRFKSESDLSLIETVIDRKKERDQMSSNFQTTTPDMFELPISLEMGDEACQEWAPDPPQRRQRSQSLTRKKLKKHNTITRRHSDDRFEQSDASTPTIHSIDLDRGSSAKVDDEERSRKAAKILKEMKDRASLYAENRPRPECRYRLGKGGSQVVAKARRYIDSGKKLFKHLTDTNGEGDRDNKSLDSPLAHLLKILAERDWLKADMTSDLLCEVLDVSIPLLQWTPNLSLRTVKLLGQIVLLCIAFNKGARRHVFFRHLSVFLLYLPRFTLRFMQSEVRCHHSILPHITHSFSTLLSTSYSEDDQKIVRHTKRDAFRYLVVSGYIRRIVELISIMMETVPPDKIDNEWRVVYKIVALVESLTTVDMDGDPYPEEIIEVLRDTDFAGMFAVLGWVTYGVPTTDPRSVWQKPMSEAQVKIFNSAMRVINNYGKLRLPLFTTVTESLYVEIYHLLVFALNYSSFHLTDHTQPSLSQETLLFTSLCTLPPQQSLLEIFRWGKGEPLVHVLCEFPFAFFLNPDGQRQLFPTLINITYNSPENTILMMRKLNPMYLSDFLKRCICGLPDSFFDDPKPDLSAVKNADAQSLVSTFPVDLWQQACDFYVTNSCCTYIYNDTEEEETASVES